MRCRSWRSFGFLLVGCYKHVTPDGAASDGKICFTLAPALSPGEGELVSALGGFRDAGFTTVLFDESAAAILFPLLGGEGQGEGEQ